MKSKSIEEISKRMAGIDIAILSTHTENGQIANRPMSNNGDVQYDGTSYYFTFEQSRTVSDIQANPKVALGFTSEGGIFSDAIYVAVEGNAELIRDKGLLQGSLGERPGSLVRARHRHARHRAGEGEGVTHHLLGRRRRRRSEAIGRRPARPRATSAFLFARTHAYSVPSAMAPIFPEDEKIGSGNKRLARPGCDGRRMWALSDRLSRRLLSHWPPGRLS